MFSFVNNVVEFIQRQDMLWPIVHDVIVDFVIAMYPLKLPYYVQLWILDALPHVECAHTEYRKLRLIYCVSDTIQRILTCRID